VLCVLVSLHEYVDAEELVLAMDEDVQDSEDVDSVEVLDELELAAAEEVVGACQELLVWPKNWPALGMPLLVLAEPRRPAALDPLLLSLSSPPALKTMKLAVDPASTVTTQKAPPPAPLVAEPIISLTPFWLGSMAQGRPLQPPLGQSILTPHVGIWFRKGVVGSR